MIDCYIRNLGTINYPRAWKIQEEISTKMSEGKNCHTLLILEHTPVFTIGLRGKREDILLGEESLESMGISIHEADRGGEVTYHGPGQLVVYPIVKLGPSKGPSNYVRTLEQVIIQTLADYDVIAHSIIGQTGVWVESKKIGSIGIKIVKGVTRHGLSINVNTDLSFFNYIIPCGMRNNEVTSMKAILGMSLDVEMISKSLSHHFGKLMGFRMIAP